MKRRDLIKRFEKAGWFFVREGSEHTIYSNGKQKEQIPRHREINEILAMFLTRKRPCRFFSNRPQRNCRAIS